MIRNSQKKCLKLLFGSIPLFLILSASFIMQDVLNQFFLIKPELVKQGASFFTLQNIAIMSLEMILFIFFQAGSYGYVISKIKTDKASLQTFFTSCQKHFFSLFSLNLAFFCMWIFLVASIAATFFLIKTIASFWIELSFSIMIFYTLTSACTIILASAYLFLDLLYAPIILIAENSTIFRSMKKSLKVMQTHRSISVGLAAIYILAVPIYALLTFFENLLPASELLIVFPNAALTMGFQIYWMILVTYVYFQLPRNESTQNQISCASTSEI